jgi:hypothetical protein
MQQLTITHVRWWQDHRHYVGLGHLDQGRCKSSEPTVPTARESWRPLCRGIQRGRSYGATEW